MNEGIDTHLRKARRKLRITYIDPDALLRTQIQRLRCLGGPSAVSTTDQ
jgi:hypothetical protein